MHLAHKSKGHISNIKNKKQNKITRARFFIVFDLQQRQKQESNRIAKKKGGENGLWITCVTTLARMTAWHRRDMLLISLQMVSWGMTLHSSNNASSNSWIWGGVVGYGDAYRLNPKGIQYNLGQDCVGGQSMTWFPDSSRKHVVTVEVWALAPSCINTKSGPISCAKGRLWFCTSSSTYLSPVKFPRMKMRSVLLFKEITPQTISDPPPYATVCSKLGGRFRSPLHRHTLTWPSVPERKNLDSSENIIGVQCRSCQLIW